MIDRNDPAWLAVKRTILEQIEKLRDTLETIGFSDVETAQARGEIAFARRLIRLVEPDAPITEPTSTDYMQVRAPAAN